MLDYESLFFKALSHIVDANGGSLEEALDACGVFEEEDREFIKKEFNWNDEEKDEENLCIIFTKR